MRSPYSNTKYQSVKRKAQNNYRNKYRDGGDCLDIEDRGRDV